MTSCSFVFPDVTDIVKLNHKMQEKFIQHQIFLVRTWLRLNWKLPRFTAGMRHHIQTVCAEQEAYSNIWDNEPSSSSFFFAFFLFERTSFLIVMTIFNLSLLLFHITFLSLPPSKKTPLIFSFHPLPPCSLCFKSDCHIIIEDVRGCSGRFMEYLASARGSRF